jgi:hypothetical protein
MLNSNAINGTGNGLDNLLFGNAGVNTLKGEGGRRAAATTWCWASAA